MAYDDVSSASPCGYDRCTQARPRRSSPHPRRTLTIRFPVKLEAQKGEAPVLPRMKPTEAVDAGLLRRQQQAELLQPFRQLPIESSGVFPVLEGAKQNHPQSG